MEIRHCVKCEGVGYRILKEWNPDNASPDWHFRKVECEDCTGTGHIITNAVNVEERVTEAIGINTTVGLHDPDYCSGFDETCQDDPCPDCILAIPHGE